MATKKIQISVSIDNDLYEALTKRVADRRIASISHGVNRAVYLYLREKKKDLKEDQYSTRIGGGVGGE